MPVGGLAVEATEHVLRRSWACSACRALSVKKQLPEYGAWVWLSRTQCRHRTAVRHAALCAAVPRRHAFLLMAATARLAAACLVARHLHASTATHIYYTPRSLRVCSHSLTVATGHRHTYAHGPTCARTTVTRPRSMALTMLLFTLHNLPALSQSNIHLLRFYPPAHLTRPHASCPLTHILPTHTSTHILDRPVYAQVH